MSRRRDLGSMFDEDGPGESPVPSEPAKRPAVVDEPLLNEEARQMLEERTRAAKEAAGRAAGVAAEKGKEFGKAALGAFGKWKAERRLRAEAKVEPKAVGQKNPLITEPAGATHLDNQLSQLPPTHLHVMGETGTGMTQHDIEAQKALIFATKMLEALIEDEVERGVPDEERQWHRTVADLQKVLDRQRKPAPLEDTPSEEVVEALEDSSHQSGYDTTCQLPMNGSILLAGMGSLPTEEDPFDYVDDMPAPPITDTDWHVDEVAKKSKPWILIAAGIGGVVLLAAALAYYFMLHTTTPVAAPASEIELPAPAEALTPVATPVSAHVAPVQEVPEPTQPAIDFSEPVPEVAPADPGSYGEAVEAEPAPIQVAPKPAPVAKPVRKTTPAPVAPRAKRVERAPTPAPEPQQEQQQIEQIHDFAKQLESLGGG